MGMRCPFRSGYAQQLFYKAMRFRRMAEEGVPGVSPEELRDAAEHMIREARLHDGRLGDVRRRRRRTARLKVTIYVPPR